MNWYQAQFCMFHGGKITTPKNRFYGIHYEFDQDTCETLIIKPKDTPRRAVLVITEAVRKNRLYELQQAIIIKNRVISPNRYDVPYVPCAPQPYLEKAFR